MTVPVVIMAGGRGMRLHPLTQKLPKPMLRVGSKPIIESIIDKFAAQGFKRITLCVGYLAELIEGHFGDGSSRGLDITYIHEGEPLGTAGALKFFKPTIPFIVHNADVIADVDFNDLMSAHKDRGYDATACLALYQHQIPFGVAVVQDDRIIEIREKPIENVSVVAGIYVLPPHAQQLISDGPMNMPDLLGLMSVGSYSIEGSWFDVGHFESLAVANLNWSLRLAHG